MSELLLLSKIIYPQTKKVRTWYDDYSDVCISAVYNDEIDIFYFNICISSVRLARMEHQNLEKMIYIAFGTKTRATFFQTIFDDNEFLQKISLKSIIIYTVRNVTTNFLYM